ncbi:hypothetical protein BLEM_2162 [Bifidobacterium lemurum]|uniref:ABC transporter permease n=1 Tax=Bifidobacterium lemurum TaxID=1603886 RepID=A0A261FLH2_9BIFI|nr:hypothetical protein [Bifidobacterium lemurum]OZG59987.1 hypothetical protein BLEM_2162 [Bifidobacterium lemurum]QOL34001.1 hypothetical protein BL8807_09665 [Bifidobacterium lemurum]
MRLREIIREAWRDMTSGMAGAVPLVLLSFLLVLCCAGLDVWQILDVESQAIEYREAKGNVTLIKNEDGVDGRACAQLTSQDGIEASGALRQAGEMTLNVLPDNRFVIYEVTDGLLDVVDAGNDDHQGVWLPRAVAEKLAVSQGAVLETTQGEIRVAGVYDWAEDGRDSRIGYAVLMPVASYGAFDECWASVWPSSDMTDTLRLSVFYSMDPSHSQTGQVNYTLGDTMDAYGMFSSRLTRFAVPAAGVLMALAAAAFCRRRKLELSGNMHAGAGKSAVVLQMVVEHLVPVLIGWASAYAALYVMIRLQGMTSAPDVFMIELKEGLWVLFGAWAGTMAAALTIRERDLFTHFKTR